MNRYMRLLVMFDLPVTTAVQRRAATRFRNFLLNDGYSMMQFSIYVRLCNGADAINKHRLRVQDAVPAQGAVRMMAVTERQFAGMEILTGAPQPLDQSAESSQLQFF